MGIALSVLYTPLNEIDLDEPYGAPPRHGYFADVLAELEAVEEYAATGSENVAIAHSPSQLDALVNGGRPVLIHPVSFGLGGEAPQVT